MGSSPHYELGSAEDIIINPGRQKSSIEVSNTGDRAVQVGSHYHFFEVNPALEFDRHTAWGKHLNIGAGLAIRFEAGETKEVEVVDFGGQRVVYGFAGLTNGPLDDPEIQKSAYDKLEHFLQQFSPLNYEMLVHYDALER